MRLPNIALIDLLIVANLIGSGSSIVLSVWVTWKSRLPIMKEVAIPIGIMSAFYFSLFFIRVFLNDGERLTGWPGEIGSIGAVVVWPVIWMRPLWLVYQAGEHEFDQASDAKESTDALVKEVIDRAEGS